MEPEPIKHDQPKLKVVEEPPEINIQSSITLTEKEEAIFAFLLEVLADNEKKSTLRVAGGWVRDKLLGKESDDIDIALDDMYGEEFAEMIRVRQTKEMPDGGKKAGYGVIKGNSEKSKHLETAVINVMGESIDLVNLRSEEYGEESRVPEIKIGTPEEDAQRRDLTINSLFYNINTKQVEDFTQVGLADLQKGVARTPLEPLKTLTDDPLRLLRVIRFAQRFGLSIDQPIYEAAQNPEVRTAFETKLSYERIMSEMDKMFSSRNPHISVLQMHQFDITSLCIKAPSQIAELTPEIIKNLLLVSAATCNVMGALFATLKQDLDAKLGGVSLADYNITKDKMKQFQKSCMYAGLLMPFSQFQYTKKKKVVTAVQHILIDSLKQTNELQKFVNGALSQLSEFDRVFMLYGQMDDKQQFGDEQIYDLAKTLIAIGDLYPAVEFLHIAQVVEDTGALKPEGINLDMLQTALSRHSAFNQVIDDNRLRHIHKMKPMLDGKQICALYEIKPGKVMKPLMDELIKFQILNLDADVYEVEGYMTNKKDEFLEKYS